MLAWALDIFLSFHVQPGIFLHFGLVAFESYSRTPVGAGKERKGKVHMWMFT